MQDSNSTFSNASRCRTRKHHPIEFTYKLQCANGEAVIETTDTNATLARRPRATSAGQNMYRNSVGVVTK